MKISTNVIRRCDPLENHQKGKTYGTFENLSYAFMISEQSFKWKCGKGCDNIPQNSRLCKLQGKNCSVDNHEYDDTCPGWAFGCTDSLADQVEVCRRDPDDQSSTKPHYWFKNLDNGYTYGDTSRQCGSTEILGIKRTFWPLNYVCKICLCGCTDNRIHTKTNTTRAFSLLWVATGARLVARDRMIHIQLREGKLLPYGKIDKKTERWIPLPKFEYDDNFPVTAIYSNGTRYSLEQSIDFATIQSTYMDRICLQKLIFNEGQLLTGAKFNVDYLDDDSSIGCIALDVKYGSFEYQHGNITAITNYKKQLPKPNELILNNPDDPLKFKTHPYDSEENKFIYIKESDMTKDASQTTIPFFDLLDVTTDPHVPLSGIELFHKGQVDGTSGGFISLKIYPLNLTIHMDP
ncbi:uncharacterized protein LOC122850611 [Aphidius gifuensis]|uniref:uncharacterized protein LOC122850611 n=1 Tax=Aphidius gifuensis TaxID=684658 RepID=UPI001CDC636F|nr:uncharacterized protein LOC122850611 [Aphidius gifuensis]